MRPTRVACLSLVLVGSMAGCSSTDRVDPAAYRTQDANVPIHTAKRNGSPVAGAAWGFRIKHHYRYYPEAQVYYAPDRDTYFWQQNGEWQSAMNPPDLVLVRLHSPVSVALETDQPWTEHEAVLARFGDQAPSEEKATPLDYRAALVSD